MNVFSATNAQEWDSFLGSQQFSPFLQSWTMGDVYASIGQEPVRLACHHDGKLVGICQGIFVPARRGKHIAIQYGPITSSDDAAQPLLDAMKMEAQKKGCTFLRVSPFHPASQALSSPGSKPAPMHLLAEHLWYVPLTASPWETSSSNAKARSEEEILMAMRKTTRNLVRRAERDGVTITASKDPINDVDAFIRLHDETRKRHGFTPYSNAFFRAQVKEFAPRKECTLYLAHFNGEVIAASIHMHMHGETSYHHGASTHAHAKIPASYLLQWTAICDALKRGDHIYNFWGIAPEGAKNHPFQGVTLFKTGFGGELLNLQHCFDIPLSPLYHATRTFENIRKWRRGF